MQKTKTAKLNHVRIIGGTFRSRKLTFPTIPGLRPTGDRIRETLFNWLAPAITGSKCLDLFAGSGALGMEALSRGASQVVFIDASPLVCESIRTNLNLLDPELLINNRAHVICANSLLWLDEQNKNPGNSFDIIFLDPPFDTNLIAPCCEKIERNNLLAHGGSAYIEQARRSGPAITLEPSWQPAKIKQTGNVSYQLFCRT